MSADKKLLEVFLASTIHEAKNYLGHLSETIEQLISATKDTAPSSYGQLASAQISNLNHLLTQVLIHYRGIHGNYQLHTVEVDLDDYFEQISDRLQPILEAKKATLEINIETDELAFFDEQLINNVLDTLIANALSAGALHLKLSAKTDDCGLLLLALEDDGPGLPEKLIGQPINTFGAEQAKENKTGMGLYLASQILAAHEHQGRKGSLQLANRANRKGACITLMLP